MRPNERKVKMLAPVALLAVAAIIIAPAGHHNKTGERYVVFEQSGTQQVLDMVTAKEFRCQNGRCVGIEEKEEK